MFRRFDHRSGHYVLLVLVWAALCLPNLGGPSLWDIDEGNNAEAAHEMEASGNWILPTFNYHTREDKPALLYWLQAACFHALGLNEFAARLPSALASLAAVLATYELGRRMAGKGAGLLAGLILASALLFCAAAHFANPDALLDACTLLALVFFYLDYVRGGRRWFFLCPFFAGLGMLAKGPVGLVLPAAVAFLFLLWNRQLRRLADGRLLAGVLVFLLVAGPWYALVGVETKGEWLRGFFLQHNVRRFLDPLEGHHGPIFYYLLVLFAGFTPWSVFFVLTGWDARRAWRSDAEDHTAVRFLLCWVFVFVAFYSLARTKLPNYVLPAYPAVAILLARFLDRWRRGLARPPAWLVQASLAGLALAGVGVALGLIIAGGIVDVSSLRGRRLPGLEAWAWLGALLVLGAVVSAWFAYRGRPDRLALAVCLTALFLTGSVAGWGTAAVDRYKAPRAMVQSLPADQTRLEVRVAAYGYFQPSLVFYCQREVGCLENESQVQEFLSGPLPSYLFIPETVWNALQARLAGPHHLVGRHHDLYDNREIVVVTNR